MTTVNPFHDSSICYNLRQGSSITVHDRQIIPIHDRYCKSQQPYYNSRQVLQCTTTFNITGRDKYYNFTIHDRYCKSRQLYCRSRQLLQFTTTLLQFTIGTASHSNLVTIHNGVHTAPLENVTVREKRHNYIKW